MTNRDIFYTFDMDWASDMVLQDFRQLIMECDISATVNVTHKTQILDEWKEDEKIELGIHPNYNPLLLENSEKTIDGVLSDIKEVVPEAITVRSHALTMSSIISRKYEGYGIKYELNTYIPVKKGNVIYTYDAPAGNHKVLPFIFEDDIYLAKKCCGGNINFFLGDDFTAPRIFNFHPIHLYLNTDTIETYENARPYFKDDEVLRTMRNTSTFGIRDFFLELVAKAKNDGWVSKKIKDGEWECE